jgi:hypothetical protein
LVSLKLYDEGTELFSFKLVRHGPGHKPGKSAGTNSTANGTGELHWDANRKLGE